MSGIIWFCKSCRKHGDDTFTYRMGKDVISLSKLYFDVGTIDTS